MTTLYGITVLFKILCVNDISVVVYYQNVGKTLTFCWCLRESVFYLLHFFLIIKDLSWIYMNMYTPKMALMFKQNIGHLINKFTYKISKQSIVFRCSNSKYSGHLLFLNKNKRRQKTVMPTFTFFKMWMLA